MERIQLQTYDLLGWHKLVPLLSLPMSTSNVSAYVFATRTRTDTKTQNFRTKEDMARLGDTKIQ